VKEQLEKIDMVDQVAKKNVLINQRIHCEHFYFNPVYKQLLIKRNNLIKRNKQFLDKKLIE
jgi:hypothetical protein